MSNQNREIKIEIENTKEIDEQFDEYIKLSIPIVLYGEVGKSHYLKQKFSDAVVIDAREILDFKNLTGFYAFKDGEVNYNNGILIDTMKCGRTLIIKRIDLNPNLLYFLYSVVKYRRIINSLGEVFNAHNNFKLIFTSKNRFEADDLYFVGPIQFNWTRLLPNCELLASCIKNLLSFVFTHKSRNCCYSFNQKCDKICLLRSLECIDEGACLDENGNVCGVHFRDLLQFIESLKHINKLTFDNRTTIYMNFCNTFLKHDSIEILGLLHLNQPPHTVLYEDSIGRTYPFVLSIRNLILNVKNNCKTLLVGETGSGKTSCIQYLSRNSHKHFEAATSLKIINMSADFDGTDLVGGYCTLDINKTIRDLYDNYKLNKPATLDNQILLETLKDYARNINNGNLVREIDKLYKLMEKKVNFVYKEGLLIDAMKDGTWVLLDEINLCNEETLNFIEALICKDKIIHFDSDGLRETVIHPNFRLFACMNPFGDHGKKKFDSYYFNHIHFYDFSADIDDVNLVVNSILKESHIKMDCKMIGELFFELKSKIYSKELVNRIEPLLSGRTLVRALTSIKENGQIDKTDILSVLFLTQFDFQSKIIARNIVGEYFTLPKHNLTRSFVDCGFIVTPRVQLQLKELNTAILLNYPVLIQGDTSTGKTSIIYYLASKMGKKVLRINNHEHTEATDYLGNYVTTQNGIEFKEGAFLKSLRNGDWIILDELNLASSDVLEILNRLLDDNREIFVPQLNETIKPNSECRIFATQNLEYGGRKGLSKAFRNRFIEIFFEEKDDAEVMDILHLKTELPKSFCKKMVDVYALLKNQRNVSCLMTLRDLFRWASRIPRTTFEVFETGMSILYERQRNECDRNIVYNAFCEVFSDVSGVNEFGFDYKENICFKYGDLLHNNDFIIKTKSVVKLTSLLYAAIVCNEPILLIGETGIGKTKLCNVVSEAIGNRLVTLNMHSGSESADFIGSFTLKDNCITWQNGPLLDAMIHGHSFLIDEINLAEDSVLERLNSLFESRRELYVPEIETNFVAHKNFRIFATMNPGNDFGKRELSPALRNRFSEIYYELKGHEIKEIFKMILANSCKVSHNVIEKICNSCPSGHSLRLNEAILEFLNAISERNRPFIKVNSLLSEEDITNESLHLVGYRKEDIDYYYSESSTELNIHHYSIDIKQQTRFNFNTATTKINFVRILRAMILKKGFLLEGELGVGKTSIVANIAKMMNRKCIRINLSEQTELSDLVGTYIPTSNGIEFIPSELTIGLRDGHFIILDEINLCTQSVIEGLNSVLDYRRTLFLPEMTVKVHPETKIFATMNPQNSLNGRKILPRSFRDRFIVIYMANYSDEDIKKILMSSFDPYKFFPNCSLRENIKRNILKECREENYVKWYRFTNTSFSIGRLKDMKIYKVPEDYTIIHSQIQSLERLIVSINANIPVVLSCGFGKVAMVKFVCELFDFNYFDFICHKDIDTADLLGQYHKMNTGRFEWKDSSLVNALKTKSVVVLHNPELVDKSIFDRLNSLFETERQLNVYEKGVDTNVKVHNDAKLILITNNPLNLSPALLDRCVHIKVSAELDSLDLWKLFVKNQSTLKRLHLESKINEDHDLIKRSKLKLNLQITNWKLQPIEDYRDFYIHKRRFDVLNLRPGIIKHYYTGITNILREDDIDNLFAFTVKDTAFDLRRIQYLEAYRKFSYDVPLGGTDLEKIQILEASSTSEIILRSLIFIKNCNLSITNGQQPKDLLELKKLVLKAIKDFTFNDYARLQTIVEKLSVINFTITQDFDISYLEMLMRLDEDPLKIYKEYLEYEMIRTENDINKQIYAEIKKIYKYGEGKVEPLIEELNRSKAKYITEMNKANERLPRDYKQFRKNLLEIDLQTYQTDEQLRLFFEGFSDIFNYFLLFMAKGFSFYKFKDSQSFVESIKNENNCDIVSTRCSYESLIVYILNTKNINVLKVINNGLLGTALCKLAYSIYEDNLVFDCVSLVMEGISREETFDCKEATGLSFSESIINECMKTLFHPKKEAFMFDGRKTITVDNEIGCSTFISSLPIYSTPLEVLNQIERSLSKDSNLISYEATEDEAYLSLKDLNLTYTTRELYDLRNRISKYFKTSSACTWQSSYTHFPFLLFTGLQEGGERFFLDSLVFEFYDKMKLAEKVACKSDNTKFYNTVLQYKAFDIQEEVDKKIKDAQSKLRREPKLYKKIQEDLKNYLTLPVTNILNLTFDKPKCLCEKEKGVKGFVYDFLITKGEDCGCESWIKLGEEFRRHEIESKLSRFTSKSKSEIINEFYNRTPKHKFSYEEVCLSKVVNRISEDSTHLKLIEGALKYPRPAFLYFVFQYAEDNENVTYEDGTGIKGGTGEKNISDQIKDEEEISNEYEEQKDVEEDDGVDFDNQGDISTCSEDDASETGVEGSEEDDDKGEDEREEEAKEEDKIDEEEKDDPNNNKTEDFEVDEDNTVVKDEEEVVEGSDLQEETNYGGSDEEPEKAGPENEYIYKEQALNNNQTCSVAEDYERKVFGDDPIEEALCEGEGEEQIVGNDKTGEALGEAATINFDYSDSVSHRLTLLLRSIFESNRCSKYKGDYKSGKKLNMRKLIPYIASDYRKDKIWMKRKKSDKKDYIVRLFVDNSKSMYSQAMIDTLLVTFSRLTNSFKSLGVPVEVYKFGDDLALCDIKQMTFSDSETNIDWIERFKDGINIVLTDGVFQNTSFYNNNFLIILIDRSGIKKMSKVSLCDGSLFVQRYLDQFHLKYCLVENVEELENTFILALSELIKNSSQ